MRTNVVIDDDLMAESLHVTGLKTKRAVIESALRALVQLKRQESVKSLRGKLQWGESLDDLQTTAVPQ